MQKRKAGSIKPLFPFLSGVLESPDKAPRKKGSPWIGICIHHTGIGDRNREYMNEHPDLWGKLWQGAVSWLTAKDEAYLSAHFAISREGKIIQMVSPDTDRAWHAGVSTFWHPILRKFVSGMNDYMIGIELHGDGNVMPYTNEQYESLARLCSALMERYQQIQPHCIQGHEVISPGRKTDPGKFMDWETLFALIYEWRAS